MMPTYKNSQQVKRSQWRNLPQVMLNSPTLDIRSDYIATFLKNSNVWFSLRPMVYVVSDFWPLEQYQTWISSHGEGF